MYCPRCNALTPVKHLHLQQPVACSQRNTSHSPDLALVSAKGLVVLWAPIACSSPSPAPQCALFSPVSHPSVLLHFSREIICGLYPSQLQENPDRSAQKQKQKKCSAVVTLTPLFSSLQSQLQLHITLSRSWLSLFLLLFFPSFFPLLLLLPSHLFSPSPSSVVSVCVSVCLSTCLFEGR